MIRQQQQGAAGALDTALHAARGEYIALLDQDDLWTQDKLAVHIETHRRHPEIDLTFSWFRVISDAGHEIGVHSSRQRGTIDFRGLLTDFVIGASSNVVILANCPFQRAGRESTALCQPCTIWICASASRCWLRTTCWRLART